MKRAGNRVRVKTGRESMALDGLLQRFVGRGVRWKRVGDNLAGVRKQQHIPQGVGEVDGFHIPDGFCSVSRCGELQIVNSGFDGAEVSPVDGRAVNLRTVLVMPLHADKGADGVARNRIGN